ncbi:MAG: aldo/keto reductase [Chitinispirillales bacterium]|nr:aldo/keto reductase [Chitinispirillales bacterium]
MVYKTFGKTGLKLSVLGFGAMRLPMTEKDGKPIVDYEKAVPLMRRAFELGVNYIDTAPYYCESDSEVAVGKALKGWRDKVYLSTKNPIEDASGANFRKRLENSLKKLDTDYIDFYHMWGINLESFRSSIDVKNGPVEAARKAIDEGLIKHLSFSFHDKPENMIPIIDSGYFSSVLCQYNLLDRSNEENMAYANEKGLGVVVMGPVGGGSLGAPSEVIRNMIKKEVKSTAEMALRFVLSNSHTNMALSGMEDLRMLEENVKVAAVEGVLTSDEYGQVNAILAEKKRLSELYCTGCRYCMPCPAGLNIPHIFKLMNNHKVYELTAHSKREYKALFTPVEERHVWAKPNGVSADKCVECGQCEEKCPQKLSIMKQLKETHTVLGK